MEQETRIKKFNSGAGAILCNGCSVILMEGFEGNAYNEARVRKFFPNVLPLISKESWESNDPIYCASCAANLSNGTFPESNDCDVQSQI
jgi:hypothetical protein